MKNITLKTIRYFLAGVFALFVFSTIGNAQTQRQIYSTANASPALIQQVVDAFRADLGANNGVGNSFQTGRREINWDGVPNDQAAPNVLPPNFFNTTSPRGVVFTTVGSNRFQVSANQSSGTAPRFGNIEPSYGTSFQAFSQQRLFTAISPPNPSGTNLHRVVEIDFFIPGTNIPATVNAFGAVFCDVDASSLDGSSTTIAFFRPDGSLIDNIVVPSLNNGLSFLGVRYDDERVARVVIQNGNSNIGAGNPDGGVANDVVVMDDFIYGEPHAREFHSGDADGDGVADARVFRPSTGTWFTLNSGSNTVSIVNWGLNGDIPVDGDFDGDKRADLAIYRPSQGAWFVNKSATGSVISTTFGTTGDKPVAGDYDKDGITDIAVWRPSNGNYFVLRSSNGSFFSFPFGQNGDIPVQGGAQ